ncbi:hypothetical protein JHK82_039215 [Glycine max]|nr:hypothetical protein JHK86_039392 [Glycine max]KAG5109992.1 hypothetical protein JHK82_039215 [Glycine max]KAG5121282.1 hypothetical protein JHK84_039622 [Glycine max]
MFQSNLCLQLSNSDQIISDQIIYSQLYVLLLMTAYDNSFANELLLLWQTHPFQ